MLKSSLAKTMDFRAEYIPPLKAIAIKLVPCSQANGTIGKIPPPRTSPRCFGCPLSTHRSVNHTNFQSLIHSISAALIINSFGRVRYSLTRRTLPNNYSILGCVLWCLRSLYSIEWPGAHPFLVQRLYQHATTGFGIVSYWRLLHRL